MSFKTNYNKEINYLWNDVLKEDLIQSFIKFYGQKHEDKIRNVVENLVIIWGEKFFDKEIFQQKSNEFLCKMKEKTKFILEQLNIFYIDNDNFISKCVSMAERDIQWFYDLIKESKININVENFVLLKQYYYMWQYYIELGNVYLNDNFCVVGRNVNTSKYDSLLKVDHDEIGCIYPKEKDSFIVSLCGYGINLGVLIHEINHLLSREFLAIDYQNDEYIMQLGFNNIGDFIYEIINDYIALDIFNDLNSKLTHNFDYLLKRKNYSSGYMDLDDVCSNSIKKVYMWSKNLILNSLIEGKGYVFVNVIGEDNYNNLNHLFVGVYDNVKKIKEKHPKVKKDQIKLDEATESMFGFYLDNIYEKIISYNQYNKNLECQLEDMEKKGIIWRI